jgi:hypothetical protein
MGDKKNPISYEGDRSLADLIKFVGEKVGRTLGESTKTDEDL